MKKTKEEFAQLLNGREYRAEMTREEELIAKESGLLVCFGASDDLLEFRGIVNDEVGAYNGSVAFFVKKRGGKIDVLSEYALEEIQNLMDEHEIDFELPKLKVVAEWSPNDLDCSWRINSELSNATFDIMEHEELYCRGIVIELSDIENFLSKK